MFKPVSAIAGLCLAASPLAAQPESFHSGPVVTGFGNIASAEGALPVPADAEFRIVFDVSERAAPGEINRTFEAAARFLNMHVAAGVPATNIDLAIVVHGGASLDLTRPEFYAARQEGAVNANAAAIEALTAHGVDIYLCGQTAAYYEIGRGDLLPGVEMALSAMTAHALLQQRGYTLNPF